jgi:hypothetical protein
MARVHLHGDTDIEISFLADNLEEAAPLHWERIDDVEIEDHYHCIVCTRAVPALDVPTYRAGVRYLCGFCYAVFMTPTG